jgi:hypothetical protein
VTLPDRNSSKVVSDKQPNVVADVHDDVKHIPMSPSMPPISSPAVLVASAKPKSRPQTVTDAYPLYPSLRRASDITAASNEKIGCPVPTTEETVILTHPNMSANALDRQDRAVADDHAEVLQTPRSSLPPCAIPAVAVDWLGPKLRPLTVNNAPPLRGAFSSTLDIIAESKL